MLEKESDRSIRNTLCIFTSSSQWGACGTLIVEKWAHLNLDLGFFRTVEAYPTTNDLHEKTSGISGYSTST